jgi:hypothetical protein
MGIFSADAQSLTRSLKRLSESDIRGLKLEVIEELRLEVERVHREKLRIIEADSARREPGR